MSITVNDTDDEVEKIGHDNHQIGTNDTNVDQIHSTKNSLRRRGRPSHPKTNATYKHQCNDCNYATNKLGNFERHHVVHTGEKPFKCKFCARKFTQKSYLTIHTRHFHDSASNH